MQYHLITVRSKEDASLIAHAVSKRFSNYSIHTQEVPASCGGRGSDAVEHKITVDAIVESALVIQTYAQAWYDGLVYGRIDALLNMKENIEHALQVANPHHPIHDKEKGL